MNDWHFGFTGTQSGLTFPQEASLITVLMQLQGEGFEWMHNGDCIGADAQAARMWRELGGMVFGHPPLIRAKRALFRFDQQADPKGYRERNQDIVDESSVMVACPIGLEKDWPRSGTWMTVRMARNVGKQTTIIWRDGKVTYDGT